MILPTQCTEGAQALLAFLHEVRRRPLGSKLQADLVSIVLRVLGASRLSQTMVYLELRDAEFWCALPLLH